MPEEKKEETSMKKLGLAAASTLVLGIGAGMSIAKTDVAAGTSYAQKDFCYSVEGKSADLVFTRTKDGKPVSYKTVRVSEDGKVRANGTSTIVKASVPKSLTEAMKDFQSGKYNALASAGD